MGNSFLHHGETLKVKLVLPGRPSLSLTSTLTIYSPGGSSVSGISMPSAWMNGLTRAVRSTLGVRR